MANKNDLFDFDEAIASNNDNVQGANIAENCAPAGINNAIRGLASIVKRAVGSQGSAIASAATTAVGAPGTALYTKITGTTPITSFGTVAAGTLRILEFEGALTLTHNATSLILPGAANITTRAGDTTLFVSEGSGNWRCLNYQPAAGLPGEDLLFVQTASSSATIDFVLTNYLACYRAFKVVLTGVAPVTDVVVLQLRTSTNAGVSYDSGASDYIYTLYSRNDAGADGSVQSAGAAAIVLASNLGNAANENVSGEVKIYNPAGITHVKALYDFAITTATPTFAILRGAAKRAVAADVDAIRFLMSSGNIASGTFALYGIR